jgi:hypothetical protein
MIRSKASFRNPFQVIASSNSTNKVLCIYIHFVVPPTDSDLESEPIGAMGQVSAKRCVLVPTRTWDVQDHSQAVIARCSCLQASTTAASPPDCNRGLGFKVLDKVSLLLFNSSQAWLMLGWYRALHRVELASNFEM